MRDGAARRAPAPTPSPRARPGACGRPPVSPPPSRTSALNRRRRSPAGRSPARRSAALGAVADDSDRVLVAGGMIPLSMMSLGVGGEERGGTHVFLVVDGFETAPGGGAPVTGSRPETPIGRAGSSAATSSRASTADPSRTPPMSEILRSTPVGRPRGRLRPRRRDHDDTRPRRAEGLPLLRLFDPGRAARRHRPRPRRPRSLRRPRSYGAELDGVSRNGPADRSGSRSANHHQVRGEPSSAPATFAYRIAEALPGTTIPSASSAARADG